MAGNEMTKIEKLKALEYVIMILDEAIVNSLESAAKNKNNEDINKTAICQAACFSETKNFLMDTHLNINNEE